jgi:hypothetical protein
MVEWEELSPIEQSTKKLKAQRDILFFAEDPYFLGIDLWPKQKEILSTFYQTYPDGSPIYNELIIYAGMRSSKTTLASIVGCFELYGLLILKDPAAYWGLMKGAEIFIINVATNETQALDTIFAHTRARITHSPFFMSFYPTEYTDEFWFKEKNIIVRSGGSNSASIVGKTVKCALFDELTRFKDNTGRFSGKSSYNSLGRSTKTFLMYGKKVVVGSPMYDGDVIMQVVEEAKGLSNTLSYILATWEINPNITEESLADEKHKDPEAYWRDFGAKPPKQTDEYIREKKRLKVNEKRKNWAEYIEVDQQGHLNFNLPQVVEKTQEGQPKLSSIIEPGFFVLAGDPAVKNDAFGLALGHKIRYDDKVTIDLLYRFEVEEGENEIDAELVHEYIMALIDKVPIDLVIFDTWLYPSIIQAIEKRNIKVEQHIVKKNDYDVLKSYFYLDDDHEMFDVCNYPFVLTEMKNLLIIKGNSIDHPRMMKDIEGNSYRGSKDVSDAMANVLWGLIEWPKLKEKKLKKTFVHLYQKRF